MAGYLASGNFRFQVDVADLVSSLGVDWQGKELALSDQNWLANVPGARRIKLVKIGADSNRVRVEVKANARQAQVQAAFVGAERLKPGLQLITPLRVTPAEVWLTGSDEALAALPVDEQTSRIKVLTEPVDVALKTQTSLVTVGLRLPQSIEVVNRPSRTVEVALEIQEVQTIREVQGIKLDFQPVASDSLRMEYTTHTAVATVFGPASLLQQLTPQSLEASVVRPPEEVPGQSRDLPIEMRLSPTLPEEVRAKVSIKSYEPRSVVVRYVAHD